MPSINTSVSVVLPRGTLLHASVITPESVYSAVTSAVLDASCHVVILSDCCVNSEKSLTSLKTVNISTYMTINNYQYTVNTCEQKMYEYTLQLIV